MAPDDKRAFCFRHIELEQKLGQNEGRLVAMERDVERHEDALADLYTLERASATALADLKARVFIYGAAVGGGIGAAMGLLVFFLTNHFGK